MWATLAAKNVGEGDVDDAVELRNKISDKVTDEERAVTASLMKNWQNVACQWAQLFPLSKNTDK
jgi:hypothetical protein